MAIEHFQIRYNGVNLTQPQVGVCEILAPFSGKIRKIAVLTGYADSGANPPEVDYTRWNGKLDGVGLFDGNLIEIGGRTVSGVKDALNIPVTFGQKVRLDLVEITQAFVKAPITLQVSFDDEVPAGSGGGAALPAGDLNAATNKLEKIQGLNVLIGTQNNENHSDSFNDATVDYVNKWSKINGNVAGFTISIVDGKLRFNRTATDALSNGIKTKSPGNFTGKFASILSTAENALDVVGTANYFIFTFNQANRALFEIYDDNYQAVSRPRLTAYYEENGVTNSAFVTLAVNTPVYLRTRHDAATNKIFQEYSFDKLNWTVLLQNAVGATVDLSQTDIFIQTNNAPGSPANITEWDSFSTDIGSVKTILNRAFVGYNEIENRLELLPPTVSIQEAPVAANSPGTKGDVSFTTDYFYICVAPNLWKRTPVAAW